MMDLRFDEAAQGAGSSFTNVGKIFDYEGSKITFRSENGYVMVNANEMAKPFGKRPWDYLNTQSVKDYINELIVSQNGNSRFDPVVVSRGGSNPSTWMHEDVALDFAQWLSPKFKVWCNQRIKELLTTGKTSLHETEDQILLTAMSILTERVKKQSQQLLTQAPKVQYYNDVLQSENLYPITLIAKEMGLSAKAMNKLLHERGIQFSQHGVWVLYSKYQDMGLTKTKTHSYVDSNGKYHTKMLTEWTEKGREFIHNMLLK